MITSFARKDSTEESIQIFKKMIMSGFKIAEKAKLLNMWDYDTKNFWRFCSLDLPFADHQGWELQRFSDPSSAPCALASLFTSVQHCLEMLVHHLVTLLYKPIQNTLHSLMIFQQSQIHNRRFYRTRGLSGNVQDLHSWGPRFKSRSRPVFRGFLNYQGKCWVGFSLPRSIWSSLSYYLSLTSPL